MVGGTCANPICVPGANSSSVKKEIACVDASAKVSLALPYFSTTPLSFNSTGNNSVVFPTGPYQTYATFSGLTAGFYQFTQTGATITNQYGNLEVYITALDGNNSLLFSGYTPLTVYIAVPTISFSATSTSNRDAANCSGTSVTIVVSLSANITNCYQALNLTDNKTYPIPFNVSHSVNNGSSGITQQILSVPQYGTFSIGLFTFNVSLGVEPTQLGYSALFTPGLGFVAIGGFPFVWVSPFAANTTYFVTEYFNSGCQNDSQIFNATLDDAAIILLGE